jgi:ATP-binding cassette subfamily B protein
MKKRDSSSVMGISYLFRYLKQYRGLVIVTLFFLIAGRLTSTLDPIWLKKIIDAVSRGDSWSAMKMILVGYFALKAATSLFDLLRDYAFAPAEVGISRTLSAVLFDHLLNLPVSYHVDQRIGGLTRQITRGSRAVVTILDFSVISILPTFLELIIVTGFLLKLYPVEYAAITFATVAAYTWFTLWSTEKRQKFRLGANQADDEVAGIEVDALTNIDTVKYFNNEELLRRHYRPAINKRYSMLVASNQMFALISSGQALILLVGLGAILYLAIDQTRAGLLTIGDLVLLSTYVVRLSVPINMLGFIYRQLKDGLADLDGMARILQEDITVPEPEHPQTIAHPQGEVKFDHVSFSYPNKRVVLKDVSFTAKPGQRIAFVGPSGVGKSTVVKLLFRLFEPTAGDIFVDGVNLNLLGKDTRRSLFAIVPQEPALFNTSIGENIRFGKPDATKAEIEHAAKLASIDTYIQGLPEKYDTVVGERGVKLSGGEKQRLAIARAIIRDPKVLVFDEATSSLDSHSEQEIQKALDTVAEGRTTITVSHRLSNIANSDMIYVLKEGKVAEQGTHTQLLDKDGVYAHLWKLQIEKSRVTD